MSRGKQAFFTLAALAAIALLAVQPASAVATSGSVAATDERAPEPPANLFGIAVADGVELTWELSPSDFVRQSPTGTDFTAGGTFANVNDVAGYNVYLGADLVGQAKAGETSFIDPTPISGTYEVRAVDAAGNESADSPTTIVNLGAAPIAEITPDDATVDLGDVLPDGDGVQGYVVANLATADDAVLSATVTVDGDGFSSPTEVITLDPEGSTTFEVFFVAADVGNLNGDYTGTLTVRTNDPDLREFVVSYTASITQGIGEQILSVDPGFIRFSQTILEATRDRDVTITNDGGLTLEGDVALSGDAPFSLSGVSTFSLEAFESSVVTVSFTPTEVGSFTGELTVTSNDPLQPIDVIEIQGRGVEQIRSTAAVEKRTTVIRLPFTGTVTIPGVGPINADDNAAVEAFLADEEAQETAAVEAGEAVAEAMGIDPSRIINGRWIQGSLIFVFDVAPAEEGSDEPTPEEAATTLQTVLEDTTTTNPVADIGTVDAEEVVTETVVEVLVPEDADGEIIVGWFTGSRGTSTSDQVGLDDFFLFAEFFGLREADADYDELFDIEPADEPDGDIDLDDFFIFAEEFGRIVANAAEIQDALQ